ncbi:carbon starvation induced protein CsiD [Salmonella enterica]|uniref:carbon starvation induced protein CsiD n=1 Tax=Salmonella enterica TaxID=28901 RepID=UPI00398C45E3
MTIGKNHDDLCGNQLQPPLIKTLLNRAQAALLISAEGSDHAPQAEAMVQLAKEAAPLIGCAHYEANTAR